MGNYEQISVNQKGKVTHVRLVGSKILDPDQIQKIGDELLSLLETEKKTAVLIDFHGVEFLSSAALGKLIKLNNRIKAAKGQLRLAAIRPEIYEVFRITKLDETFDIHDTVEEALSAF
jgi:anti-sigma B factor antagonist